MNKNDTRAGIFLIIGLGLLIISMLFNYSAFSTFSNVVKQQAAFIGMALLFDSLKIASAIECKNIWHRGNEVIATFTFLALILLTGVSIVAGYVYLSNVTHAKTSDNIKESLSYKMSLESVNNAQSSANSLIQFASQSQASTKNARLTEIEKQITEYNTTPVRNYNKHVVGTFGSMNRCGQGQSKYNLFCSEVDSLNKEKYKINNWLANHGAYLSAITIVGQRQQSFIELGNGTSNVGLVDGHQLEPFVSFSRWFTVSYIVAESYSMFVLAVMCELFATLCFVVYSLSNSRPIIGSLMTKLNRQSKQTAIHRKSPSVVSFDENLSVIEHEKKAPSLNRKPLILSDNSYDRITDMVTNGVCPPTLHSLRKHHGMTKRQVDTYQSKWIDDGIIESYDRGNGISTYRLVT